MRFVIDDARWASNDIATEALEKGLDNLSDLIEATISSGHRIGLFSDIWKLFLIGTDTLTALLYEKDNPRNIARTIRLRLARQFDKMASITFDEDSLSALDAEIDGETLLAPAAVLAWQEAKKRTALGCISLQTSGRRGCIGVGVSGEEQPVHFVFDKSTQVAFFRHAIQLENVDENGFGELAPAAFPNLRFVTGVWRGLRDLSKPYRDRRDEIIHCFSVLSDDGAAIFALKQNALIESEFGSRGVTISPETTETMKDAYCKRARTRDYADESLVFEWHIKLEPHLDRIHVHPGTASSEQRIIIGIIHKHLPLPRD
jgi:hypothetical protein